MSTDTAASSTASPTGWRKILSLVFLRHPFWERSWLHRVGRFLALLGYVYCGIVVVLLLLEDWFLYRPSTAAEWWLDSPAGLVYEDVEFRSADGSMLHGWWCEPEGWSPEQGAMLFSHGNAGNISSRGARLLHLQQQSKLAVFIYDYPGYGKSPGSPSESKLYAAGDGAYDWLTKTKGIPADKLLLFGESLGGAVAVDLASRRACRALLLVSAFTSFPDMAHKTFPWLPTRWLVRNQLDNLAKIGKVRVPVFIAHGTADRLVPFSQGERLFAAANEPKTFCPMPGLGHNDGARKGFHESMEAFLASLPSEG